MPNALPRFVPFCPTSFVGLVALLAAPHAISGVLVLDRPAPRVAVHTASDKSDTLTQSEPHETIDSESSAPLGLEMLDQEIGAIVDHPSLDHVVVVETELTASTIDQPDPDPHADAVEITAPPAELLALEVLTGSATQFAPADRFSLAVATEALFMASDHVEAQIVLGDDMFAPHAPGSNRTMLAATSGSEDLNLLSFQW